jgi:acyl-CoA thioesterase FadM
MLTDYPVVVDVAVRWGDQDALGHVTNSAYLQFFETARIAYIERMGMPAPRLDLWDHGFIIAASNCRYLGSRVPLRADRRAAIIALEGCEPPPLPPRRSRRSRTAE